MADEYTRIQIRRGSASDFTNADPILASGEPAYSLDNKSLRVGDGNSTWSNLSEVASAKSARSYTFSSTSFTEWLPSYAVDLIRVTSLSGSTSISGINALYSKKQFTVINAHTGGSTITFQHNAVSDANGIYCIPSNDIVLNYGDAIVLTYDPSASRWVGIKQGFTSNPIQSLTAAQYNALVAANNVDPNTIYVVT